MDNLSILPDILPPHEPMKMLIVGKTPIPSVVQKRHYFEGIQGRMLWKLLIDYGLLTVPPGKHADEMLVEHGYGITNIVKTPHKFGDEPTNEEYRQGIPRVLEIIREMQPQVTVFVYKRALDTLLRLAFGWEGQTRYGFNPEVDHLIGSKTFVFPMPGTPCRRECAQNVMTELRNELQKLKD